MASAELEIPRSLPVDHLSPSSVSTYLKCPERWYRKYILREYELASGSMILGGAVGAAEAHSDQQQIDTGARLTTAEVLDLYSDEFEDRKQREEIKWDGAPGEVKDSGTKVVEIYERELVPALQPVSVEREFTIEIAGVDWTYKGYLDLEEADGGVVDRKVKGKKLGQGDADVDIQPTSYLLARRTEGKPAPEFRYHTMVRTKNPYAEIVTTRRTDAQLDALLSRIYNVAAEINWRLENEVWGGAVPGSWWCSQRFCGFWDSCPMGGAR